MRDTVFMQLALEQARAAAAAGEVPVGAVVVKDGVVVATGRNDPIHRNDPTAHAEMQALRVAALALGNYRLDGCELFVTLEPCAMCSGAMLHARLDRVVFGAADPKTGAAGSVVDLFAQTQLNHHTRVQGGVLADVCAGVLQDFFVERRAAQLRQRRAQHPLRDDALRTPDSRFRELPGYPWQPHYISHLSSLAGLRMHYLDEGPMDAPRTYLCLHASSTWNYFFREMMPIFLQAGCRVVAPDFIGFGKSDKPKKESKHSLRFHHQTLLELVRELGLRNVILVVQDDGESLGQSLTNAEPDRFVGLLVMKTMLNTVACSAYAAPFPDKGHRAAVRAFPAMVADHVNNGAATRSSHAREIGQAPWQGTTWMTIGMQNPASNLLVLESVLQAMRGHPEPLHPDEVERVHSQWSARIARAAVAHFSETKA